MTHSYTLKVLCLLAGGLLIYSLLPLSTDPLSWPLSAMAQDAHNHAADDHAAPAADPHAGHAHGDEEGGIELSPETMREFGMETETASPGTLLTELRVPGEVAGNPNLVAHVVPRAPGIVESVRKQVGDSVTAGERLAIIDSPELSEAKALYHTKLQELELDQIDHRRAQAIADHTRQALALLAQDPPLSKLSELEGLDLGGNRRELIGSYAAMLTARTTLQRKQRLHDQDIASDAELQEAESAYKQAQADFIAARDAISYDNERALLAVQRETKMAEIAVRAAERHLHALGLDEEAVREIPQQQDQALSRLEVTAPIDGLVIQRHLVKGEKVGTDEAVFVIADYATVWVFLTLHQQEITAVEPGMPVSLSLSGSELTAEGTIDVVSPEVDEKTRTATARVVLDNAAGAWRPGAFVTGRIALRSKEARLVVPKAAIIRVEDRPTIFVQTGHGFEPRTVRTGASAGGQIEILDGLEPGETYVSRNALPLKAELNRAALEHAGHAH